MPGYVVESWYGLYAPTGTAPDVVNVLNASVAKAIRAGIFKTIETNEGLMFARGTPEDFGRFVLERKYPSAVNDGLPFPAQSAAHVDQGLAMSGSSRRNSV